MSLADLNRDPLADEEGPCSCDDGWVTAGEAAAMELLPNATDEQRRSWRNNTVYPCRRHRPEQFERWHRGHYGADHDHDGCPACVDAAESRRRPRRRPRRPPAESAEREPDRKDITE